MTLVFLIPDGVGIRNFVLGSFLQRASSRQPVHTFHVVGEEELEPYRNQLNGTTHWHRLEQYRERPIPFVLRSGIEYAHMNWIDNPAMRMKRQAPVNGSWRTRAAIRVARLLGRTAASPRGIQLLDRQHVSAVRRLPEVEHYRRLFRGIRPRLLFCTNQRPASVVPPVLAAQSLGIPTATFIFSWDNLSSKGRIAAPFDHFLLWSEHMRRELFRFYPEVTEDRTHIVGTPQFEPYAATDLLWSREAFFRRIGAQADRQLICYSGGDVNCAREDPQHVRVLLQQIRSGVIRGNPQVLLRPSPVDTGTRYAQVRRDFPELLYHQPAWKHEQGGDWSNVIPTASDVEFLVNLTFHSDLNVNYASTMTLDFAIRDKPVINLAFDVTDPPVYGVPIWEHLQRFEHYRPVIKLRAAKLARSADQLAAQVNGYLDDPTLDADGRRRFVDTEIGVPIGSSVSRILEVLEQIQVEKQN